MKSGFLGYDASFMLDFVVTALVLIVPLLALSIALVKQHQAYQAHRLLQWTLAGILLVAVTAFEVDLQIVHGGWKNVVNKNPEMPRLTGIALDRAQQVLWVHLIFAVSTPFLWAITILFAHKRFPSPPRPGRHSELHKKLGWASILDLVMTAVTGVGFYYFAFVAPA